MQRDKNDMENKLKQLENQQLPDLSQMDEHWQAMSQMLAPGARPSMGSGNFLKRNSKFLLFAASVISIIMLVWFLQNNSNDKKEKTKEAVINVPDISPEKDQGKGIVLVDTLFKPGTKKNKLTSDPIYADVNMDRDFKEGDSASIDKGNGAQDFFMGGNNKTELPATAKITLNSFYDEIQKQVQAFTINAERGGNIKCSEGTVLMIPPAAFVDANGNNISGEVNIVILEYYKYSDMIAANLTTMSDGRQLITGGMLKITAEYKSKPVKLRSDKAIDITMPTKNFDAAMQLFESSSETNKIPASYTGDRPAAFTSARYRNINWQLFGMQSSMPAFDGRTTFLDMSDDPFEFKYGKKYVGKFAIPKNSDLTVAEAKKILTERYGYYYDKIKVKRSRKKQPQYDQELGNGLVQIGDSVRLTLDQAIRWQYIDRKDSAFYAEKIKRDSINFYKKYLVRMLLGDSMVLKKRLFGGSVITFKQRKDILINQDSLNKYYELYIKTQQTYSFRIKNLGWINCDRFSNYEDKSDFIINLPAGVKGSDFVSQLAFVNIRSVMPGKTYENKIGFANVPVNMPVYLVGLGEKDGKVVSFIEKLKTGQSEVNVTNFEETTAEAFKNKLAILDVQ
jgi:hypothetical protein